MAAAAAAFARRKAQRLGRRDASRSGRVDARAAPVVRLLNARPQFCTASSCAGRLLLARPDPDGDAEARGFAARKRGCAWLLVTHELCTKDQLMTALEEVAGDVVFKFEPFVLHVLCRELQDAQLLHSVAVDSGFRNSGITVGKKGKIVMAVRSTHCLEVPLSHMGKLMVSEEYIEFLIHTANQKMEENMRRIDRYEEQNRQKSQVAEDQMEAADALTFIKTNPTKSTTITAHIFPSRFYNCLQVALETAPSADNSLPEEREKSHDVYVRRRKRETVQKRDACTSPGDHNEELEQEDDPEGNVDIFGEIME